MVSGNYGNLGNNFGAAEPQNVTFHMVKNVEGFNGYIAPSDYIKETRLTGNDRIKCAAECVLITDCLSFFLDTNKSVCQFHSTIIGTTSWLTSSPSSLYFKVATGMRNYGAQYVSCSTYFFETLSMLIFFFYKSMFFFENKQNC